jgi:hypothetical protein
MLGFDVYSTDPAVTTPLMYLAHIPELLSYLFGYPQLPEYTKLRHPSTSAVNIAVA